VFLQERDGGGGISVQMVWLAIVVLFTLFDLFTRSRRKGQQQPPAPPPGGAGPAELPEDEPEEVPIPAAPERTPAEILSGEDLAERAKARLEEQIDEWLTGGRGREERQRAEDETQHDPHQEQADRGDGDDRRDATDGDRQPSHPIRNGDDARRLPSAN
jgi:hypothetical protein